MNGANQPSAKAERSGAFAGRLYVFVYARHGRELMGFESPVSVPVISESLS